MQMTIEENKAIARKFFEDAWNKNKTDDVEEYISTDRIHHYGAKSAKKDQMSSEPLSKDGAPQCQITDAMSRI
jgi:hypothetical protein